VIGNLHSTNSDSNLRAGKCTTNTLCYSVIISAGISFIFTTMLYVPMAIEQSQLRNRIMILESHIDSGCNITGKLIQKEQEYLILEQPYNFNVSLVGAVHSHPYDSTLFHDYTKLPVFLKISNFNDMVDKKVLYTQPFFVFEEGYLMYLTVYPSGYGNGEGTHMSVYLHLLKGPYDNELQESGYWPLKGTFVIELLNILTNDSHYGYLLPLNYQRCELCTSQVINGYQAHLGWGYSQFISHDTLLHQNGYLSNNNLYVRISYNVHNEEYTSIVKTKLRFMFVISSCYLINVCFLYLFYTLSSVLNTFDITHFKIVTLLPSILMDIIKTISVIELPLAADLLLVLFSNYFTIDDSISSIVHYALMRLWIVILFASAGSSFILRCVKEGPIVSPANPLWISIITARNLQNYNTSRYLVITFQHSLLTRLLVDLLWQ